MLDTLLVNVNRRNKDGVEGWEGTVTIPGLSNAKLARKDGNTFFSTRSTLNTVARNLGKRLDLEVKFTEPLKKAAKKSTKSSTSCSPTC